jgi:hypothetical protein
MNKEKKRNKLSIWIICIVLLLTVGTASADGIDKIYISNSSGDTGSKITVSVNAENMKNLGSLQFDVQYDKNVLIAENVIAGNATTGGMFTSNIRITGMTIGIISTTGISGSGSIADIIFNVVGSKETSSPLTISMVSATDSKNNPIDILSIDNATFTVIGEGVTGTVIPTVTTSPTVGTSPTTTRMIPNPDNGSGGDTGVRSSSRNGETSNGNVSNVGNLNSSASTQVETPMVTTTKESTVSTTIVPEETVVPEETTEQQKKTQPENTQKSPGLGMVASITILSLIYILERKKRQRKQN